MSRYRQGFSDGSGATCIVDTETGRIIAVTNWGCTCCEGEETPEKIEAARKIVEKMNEASVGKETDHV